MALLFKPHTVTVETIEEIPDPTSRRVGVPSYAAAKTVIGHLYPEKPTEANAATGAFLNAPHTFLCDLGDAGAFTYGSRVRKVGTDRTLYVHIPPAQYDAGGPADVAAVLLSETMVADV